MPNGQEESSLTDVNKIMGILDANKDKNFVKRIIDPTNYPTTDMPKELQEYGDWGTHLMSWDNGPTGNPMVYPRIVHDQQNDKLNILDQKQAYDHALKTGEYIDFKTSAEADWFGQNYKKAWNPDGQGIPRWEYPPKGQVTP